MARIRRLLTGAAPLVDVHHRPLPSRGLARPVDDFRSWTVISAALSPVLLTVGWLVAGAFQPPSYSPMRQTVSVMAGYTGTDRWIMTWAMLLTGVCYILTASGMGALWLPARILLVVAGLCSIGIALSPEPLTGPTAVHLAWTSLGCATIAVWPAIVAWRAPPALAAVSGRNAVVVTAVFAAMAGWVMFEIWFGHDLGLAERLTASTQSAWPLAVALTWRRAAGPQRAAAATATVSWPPPEAAPMLHSTAEYGSQGVPQGAPPGRQR
jgi:hypothetical membrane protein